MPATVRAEPVLLTRSGRSGAVTYLADTSHGLASNQLHRLARDAQSRVWLASPVGLSCFDGSFIGSWDRTRGLLCQGLRTVCIDAFGTIWIGTDIGLERLDATGAVLPNALAGNWRFGLCQHIAPDAEGAWLGTARGLVRVTRDGAGLAASPGFVADIGFVNDVLVLSDGHVLAASTGQSLVETDGRSWWNCDCDGLGDRKVVRLAVGDATHLLAATDAGLHVLDARGRTVLSRLALAGVQQAVGAVAAGVDCHWAAFGRIVASFATDLASPRILEWFELDSPVNDLLCDPLGNLWIATNNHGLAQVSCLRQAVRRIDLGPRGVGGVYSITSDHRDVFTIGGESLFGSVTLPPEVDAAQLISPPGLPEVTVWDSLRSAAGSWVATQAGLFHAPPVGAFDQLFANDMVLGAPGRVLLERDGDLWVGTLRGLACIRGAEVTHIEADDGALGYVYTLYRDRQGALWIGTLGRGLWREHDGLQSISRSPLTAWGNTYALSQATDGRFAVVQDDNVVVLSADLTVQRVIQLPPLAGWAVSWIDAHTLALGTSDGLRIIDTDRGIVVRHVRSMLRRRDWEFTTSRALLRDSAGHWLCGLSSGLVRVDLERLQSYSPPECKLLDVVWTGIRPEVLGDELQLRPGRWSFRLRAYCAWFVDCTQVQVQFQLVGFDADWQAWQEQPMVAYNSLPPGRYKLIARARSPLTGSGPTGELLHLRVRRPLWAIGWTALLASAEAGYDLLVRARNRNRDLLEANRRLEAAVVERTERLRASNQELSALRDAYRQLAEVDALTGVANRRSFDKELTRCMAVTRRSGSPLSLLMVDVDRFKAVNDRYGHQTGDAYLRAIGALLAGSLRAGVDLATRYGGEEFALLMQSTDADGARLLAERLRVGVEALQLRNDGTAPGHVTVSIGVATTARPGPDAEADLVARADHALYRAKQQGRNRVVVAEAAA
jgi:diguanylate cyclase (GGDEF)-like protein